MSKEYCISHHDDKVCFRNSCRYHNILKGDVKEFLQKLDAFYFNYQHVNCLYTLFMYQYGVENVVNSGQVFDNVQRAVHFIHQNRGLDKLLCIAKKRLLRKKVQKILLSCFQKTKSTQTSGSDFVDRIGLVKKTKFELELTKIVNCFLGCHGHYTINLVASKKNLCKFTVF